MMVLYSREIQMSWKVLAILPVKYLVFRNSRKIYICLSICSQSWYYMQLPDCFQVEVSTVNEWVVHCIQSWSALFIS